MKHKRQKTNYVPLVIFLCILVIALIFFWSHSRQTHTVLGNTTSLIDDTPVTKKVFLLIFNPTIESRGNQTLVQVMHWQDPDDITSQVQSRIAQASNGFVSYTIAERQVVDGIFVKPDGFQYTDDTYLACTANHSTCHNPDLISYTQLFSTFNICSKNVDEVWIWGGPWFGYLEYNPVKYCGGKTQFVMGFNYERAIDEALHDFGHRMEYVANMRVGNGNWQANENNDFNKFALIQTHCGNVHVPPGPDTTRAYIYDNTTPTTTDCDGYLHYPDGPFIPQTITCTAWGCTQRGYMSWWLGHIPHNTGTSVTTTDHKTVYNNWWKYYAYFDETVISLSPTYTPTPSPTRYTYYIPTPTPTRIPTPTPTRSVAHLTTTSTIQSPTPTPVRIVYYVDKPTPTPIPPQTTAKPPATNPSPSKTTQAVTFKNIQTPTSQPIYPSPTTPVPQFFLSAPASPPAIPPWNTYLQNISRTLPTPWWVVIFRKFGIFW